MSGGLERRLGDGSGARPPVVVDHRPTTDADAGRPVSQYVKRQRRQRRQPVVYGGDFDLVAEVHDLLEPAARGAGSRRFAAEIDEVAAAVGRLVCTVAGMVTTADARRAASHLPVEKRQRAVTLLVSEAPRPAPPVLSDGAVGSKGWIGVLTTFVGPHAAPLSDLLGRSYPPGAPELRGQLSVSERLVEALRGVDAAAASLRGAVKRQAFLAHELQSKPKPDAVSDELARLGIRR